VGKSLLFEGILLTTGHQVLSSSTSGSGDAGVGECPTKKFQFKKNKLKKCVIFNKKIDVFFISSGRFSCGSKNAVVFHDVNIAILVGADVEKVPPPKHQHSIANCLKKKIEKKIFFVKKIFLINFF